VFCPRLNACYSASGRSVRFSPSLNELQAAEKNELKVAKPQIPNQEKREEDDLKKKIDDSKYTN